MTLISLSASALLFVFMTRTNWSSKGHWKIYDGFMKIKKHAFCAPAAARDIVLVTIDNKSIVEMPHSWPYPRRYFAEAMARLTTAQAKLIAFDFAFFGTSDRQDDEILAQEINRSPVVLPSLIHEDGSLVLPALPDLDDTVAAGIITKIQDKDGVVRKNLTYVVNAENRLQGFLSWELQVLKKTVSIDMARTRATPGTLVLENDTGMSWHIPLEKRTNAFLINFFANTTAFNRLSFYDVVKGNFDPQDIKDKIVLVGILSSLLGDIHQTPIGWLPGITLNANAFLTLYTRSFLRTLPPAYDITLLVLGVTLASVFTCSFKKRRALCLIGLEIAVFFALSYVLFLAGYIWNYFLFPLSVILCPVAGRRIADVKKSGIPKKRQHR